MNHHDTTFDQETDEAASLWAARLDGSELTTEIREDLSKWLSGDPRRRTLLAEYCQFSIDLEEKLPDLLATGAVEIPEEPAAVVRRNWRPWAILGSMAAAAAVIAVLTVFQPQTQLESLTTPAAQRQSLALADGTQVDLDARTSLRIDIDKAHRHVRMAEGEVFFAVSKDASRPFTIETPHGSITVKGTKFDVQSTPDQALRVTVIEGLVQVNPIGTGGHFAPVHLTVGEQLTLTDQGTEMRKLSALQLSNVTAWRQGQVVFQGTPLSEALKRFGRYHGIGIVASNEAGQQKIGGRYSLDDLDGFFTALEEVIPVRVSHNLNGTVQVVMRDTDAARHPGK